MITSTRRSSLVALGASGLLIASTMTGCAAASSGNPRSLSRSSQPEVSATRNAAISLPANPRVYFFGDSWTSGIAAAPGRGFPYVVGAALGWSVQLGPDSGGAGYVNTFEPSHPVFPVAVASVHRIDADLIVVVGGLNDAPGPLSQFWAAMTKTVKTLRARSGDTPIVMVGPATFDGAVPEGLTAVDQEESAFASKAGIPYISPLEEHWFNTRNVKTLIDQASQHPSTAGHAYYGGRLASALARITVQK